MITVIRILSFEIRQFVRRGSFWFGFLAIPALALFLGVVVLGHSFRLDQKSSTASGIGVVDESSLTNLSQRSLYTHQLRIFPDRSSAFEALKKREITLFYLIPRTYLSDGQVICYLASQQPFKTVSPGSDNSVSNLLRLALSGGLVPEGRTQLYQNPLRLRLVYVHDSTQKDVGNESERVSRIATPALLTIMFCSVVLFSGGYLLNSVNIERQNKVFESLCARVSPVSLLLGKWLSIVLISIVQQVVYGWIVIWQAGRLGILPIEPHRLAMAIVELVLGYALISLSTLVVGLVSSAGQDSTQLGLAVLIALVAPVLIVLAPQWDSGIPRILSILPFTSPIAMLLRICFSSVAISDVLLSALATMVAIAVVMVAGCAAVKSAATGHVGPVFPWRLPKNPQAKARMGAHT